MKSKLFWWICFIALGVVGFVGCATIMHGTRQDIGISSTPTGASVSVDNFANGATPIIVNLSRSKTHLVKIEMKGYEPFEMNITKSVSGWVWGNLVIGGIPGLVIDAISGGLYSLTPEQIQASLAKNKTSFLFKKDSLYVAVVLNPEPEWHKIGTMKSIVE